MYLPKTKDEILRQSLRKLSESTPITAISPGSVARSLAEVVVDQIGEFYDILDFNLSKSVLSTATGGALDLWGTLYNMPRKRLSDLATDAATIGAFYFYVDQPAETVITIPAGTSVYATVSDTLVEEVAYRTTEQAVIGIGKLRAYVPILPATSTTTLSAGAGTLVNHDYTGTSYSLVKCTNAKAISPRVGYENDDDYRARIIKWVRTSGGGTRDAIRFSILGVSGVRDVMVRSGVYGLGTYDVIVCAEDYTQVATIVNGASNVVNTIGIPGAQAVVRAPDLKVIDITAAITLKKTNINISTVQVEYRAKNAILRYINSLSIGQELLYNQLIASILEASEYISDVTITKFSVDGTQTLRKNFALNYDEQLIPGEIVVQTL